MGEQPPKLPLPLGGSRPPANTFPWAHPSAKSKWHHDQFSHFCRADCCDQQTDSCCICSYRLHLCTLCNAACKISSSKKSKGSPYSTTECRVPELIPVLGSQPAGDVSHKPGGRLPLLSARPAVIPATLKTAATNFAAW